MTETPSFRICSCALKSWCKTFSFSFHTQRGQLSDSARIARKKKRLPPRQQAVINRAPAGHDQPFKHPHVSRSPPMGIAKLSDVFLNGQYKDIILVFGKLLLYKRFFSLSKSLSKDTYFCISFSYTILQTVYVLFFLSWCCL